MFTTVLVANRGEIAVRVMRTLRAMGIRSVAVYSDADADAPFARLADTAVRIGPAPASESYLRIDAIIDAAQRTGAQAIHPGYGFLSENVDFAAACSAAGIAFIGPPVSAMDAMADKIRAKATAVAAGVPVVPGSHAEGMSDDDVVAAVNAVGFPALLKPSAGGGGKGMRIVREGDDVRAEIAAARREARTSFGDDSLLVERYITRPRHIEVQILADTHGTVIHLGERECSLQRRHQKVIEEAPSPLLDAATRAEICASAVRLAAAVGYVGAGTVEYVVPADSPADFAFLEMNTRLQVEHPVTELVTGVDLVEQQVRIAAGEPLALTQSEIVHRGHAVEARVYAEDPERGFLPTGGDIAVWLPPSSVRVDSGIESGSHVGSTYDPMLAKVIAWGPTRTEALARLGHALDSTVCLGVTTNISFVRRVLADPAVIAGDMDTGFLGSFPADAVPDLSPALVVAGLAATQAAATSGREATGRAAGPWAGAWRVAGSAPVRWDATVGATTAELEIVESNSHDAFHGSSATVAVNGNDVAVSSISALPPIGTSTGTAHTVHITANGVTSAATVLLDAVSADSVGVWVHTPSTGARHITARHPRLRRLRGPAGDGHGGGPWLARSPMPGAIVSVAAVGQRVEAGDPVVTVEAMKMEHTLRAPAAGTVAAVHVSAGQQVRLDEDLVVVEIAEQS